MDFHDLGTGELQNMTFDEVVALAKADPEVAASCIWELLHSSPKPQRDANEMTLDQTVPKLSESDQLKKDELFKQFEAKFRQEMRQKTNLSELKANKPAEVSRREQMKKDKLWQEFKLKFHQEMRQKKMQEMKTDKPEL